jgi:FkbM family methyltransferase
VKPRQINDTYDLIVPDHVADWDAPSDWEKVRIADTLERLGPADLLLDVGVEHGWISGLYGKYIGCEMILAEPGPEFWRNIRRVWTDNKLREPVLCVQGFAGAETTHDRWWTQSWPHYSFGPESDAMAYRSIANGHPESQRIPVFRIDDLPIIPTAITIDVEGAELLVLQGAERTLLNERPIVWCSIHPDMMIRDYDTKPIEVLEYMEKMNYQHTLLAVDHEEHWRFDPLP